jgi:hypothetical protein
MTREQLIAGMLDQQGRILKIRSPKRGKPSDKVIDRVVRSKGTKRPRARHAYRLGKLGAASPVRHIVKDGKPVEQAR